MHAFTESPRHAHPGRQRRASSPPGSSLECFALGSDCSPSRVGRSGRRCTSTSTGGAWR